MVNAQPERPMKTYLYIKHNKLLNRDTETQQVMSFLFQLSKAGENNVAILPIVGPEGGGKTSLAVHCFYDPKVQKHFSLKIYIGLTQINYTNSRGFPIFLEEILKQCKITSINFYDENTLLGMLKQRLCTERFLLVLDDVWDVDCMVWNALWDCLNCGKQGSKVIFVSTFNIYKDYKKIVNPKAVTPILLDGFAEDEFMTFFSEHAFGSADPEDYPELAETGRAIAKKMNGSIWGAIILGELLRDNLNAPFWFKFLRGGFLSPLDQGDRSIFSVIEAMCLLLPNTLQVEGLVRWSGPEEHRPSPEVKTFRELMVLGPHHCTPFIKEGKNFGVRFLVIEHVFLNRFEVFTAICKPLGDESTIFLDDSACM